MTTSRQGDSSMASRFMTDPHAMRD
ncbi:WXG100 family type VII secretion target, partial [Mycobacterium tuberculosis]